jgi:7,8-dihydro-6-hydroxymethylpterin dimethyltransferase
LQDFMDPWTFNQKNLMKCCKEFLLPGGKQIPFCAYNSVGYREQARAQLEAMEPERLRARKEGKAFVPCPVTFEFGQIANANGAMPPILGQVRSVRT